MLVSIYRNKGECDHQLDINVDLQPVAARLKSLQDDPNGIALTLNLEFEDWRLVGIGQIHTCKCGNGCYRTCPGESCQNGTSGQWEHHVYPFRES